jgi:hypothetical protein
VIAAAKEKKLTAYAIAKAVKAAGGSVSIYSVQCYLDGTRDMTSAKLDGVLKVLGLSIR